MRTLLHLAALGTTCFVVVLLVAHTALYIKNAFDAISYPFGLDYGEGIIWQQALLIPSARMYGAITESPFIVFHYPPIYHLAVRAAMLLGLDPLVAGRGLSVTCTLTAAALCAWLVRWGVNDHVNGMAKIIGCTIGALLPLSLWPVEYWSMLMRVDMLAICLSILGVALVIKSVQRPAWLAIAMPIFVLALFTKQTTVAAPAGCTRGVASFQSAANNHRRNIRSDLGFAWVRLARMGDWRWLCSPHYRVQHQYFFIGKSYQSPDESQLYGFLFLSAAGALALLWRDRLHPV